MLQIRLRRVPSSEGGSGGIKQALAVESVTVACPDHLVIADLPVAKSLGSSTPSSLVKTAGRRSRRQLGERVLFCVRCDFPIALYGRLSPCEHAFCLDCARSESICYLCDERIQKIQTIKMSEGMFICAAPHCLKSFLKKTDFESHIHHTHANLLHSNTGGGPKEEEVNDPTPEITSARKPTTSDSTLQAPPPRPLFSPTSNSQLHDLDDKSRRSKPFTYPKPGPPFQTHPPQSQELGQFQDKQQGILSDEYPMRPHQPPNFGVPQMAAPPFVYPPFGPDGGPSFYGARFQMARPDSAPDVEPGQRSLLGFPPLQIGDANFSGGYPPPSWNVGHSGGHFETPPNGHDSQGRGGFFQGDYERNKETGMDPREGKGILASQPLQIPPPPPLPLHPPQSSHMNRAGFHSADAGHGGRGFGWQHDKHDNFGGGQD